MIFINNLAYDDSEAIFESVENGTYFDDMLESISLEENTINLIEELCLENSSDDRYVALNEASLKNLAVSIKTFFKVMIAKIIEFFRALFNKADKCQKRVREFLKANDDNIKPLLNKSFTAENEITIITNFTPFATIISGGTDKYRAHIEKAKTNFLGASNDMIKDLNDAMHDPIRTAGKMMTGLDVDVTKDTLLKDILDQITIKTKEVKVINIYNVLKYVASDMFTKLNQMDKKILSYTKKAEGACERVMNNLKDNFNIPSKQLQIEKTAALTTVNIHLKVIRVLVSLIVSQANICMTAMSKLISKGETQ